MTKQTEAMKLEAVYETIIQWDEGGGKRSRRELARRIVALAEQPAQQLPFGVGGGLVAIKTLLSRDPCVHANTAIEMIDAILAEQPAQQEPVAWNDEQLQMLNFLYGAGDFDGVWFDQKHPTEKGAFWWRKHLRRLFDTPPAQRTWVGLNEDQRQQVRDICDVAIPAHVFHAIDAKLKEKNT